MKNRLSFKNFFTAGFAFAVLAISSISTINTKAAFVDAAENLVFDETVSESVYLTGGSVKVNEQISRDLLVSAGEVNIEKDVSRSVFIVGGDVIINSERIGGNLQAAGGNIQINTKSVLGSLRVAGGEVVIKGLIREDVMITGGNIKFVDATIMGDVYISAGQLEFDNSTIKGDLIGEVGNYQVNNSSSIYDIVDGEVRITKSAEMNEKGFAAFATLAFAIGLIALILKFAAGLLVVGLIAMFLAKRNKLLLSKENSLNSRSYYMDMLVGFLALMSTIALLLLGVLAFFVGLQGLFFPLAIIVLMLAILVNFYTPIHLAMVFKNTFTVDVECRWLIALAYILFVFIPFIPYLGGLIVFPFYLAGFGFVLKQIYFVLKSTLTEEVKTPEKKDLKKSSSKAKK